ncbi:MarR family winged helix-turn-helix transcriptional regulator [Ramlibacter tataouinensis]|uniref:MarR family winged helix-turn-helix transcriptional regulator n=1 Tax=Ramlibacter tataouinensis TaxID=94132 RepID=UPI0022F3F82A|nr:MarR family winged helix-turn-helix transcriptional regulator [Ramlibacter tataouinensis]WBY02645.1 MarR family winged helix-turn-helix transcriptional regulator [Ramlibacter tataouinensis]
MDAAVKPQGCTHLKLRKLMRQVAQHYDAEVGKTGLKTTQYSLLAHICRLGPLRPVDLARAMKLTPSTLSRNLQPLQAAGWVAVEAGDDARSHRVAATDAGRDKYQEARRRWRVAQEQLNALLGAERVLALHALIEDCSERLAPPPTGDEE